MAGFNAEKFQELIVYIAKRLGPEAALGRVKLAKLLMKSDFRAFARLGQPITGATYEKWKHGHLPRELLLAERDLENANAIASERVEYYGKTLNHITARRDPRMASFSEDELAIIEGVLREFGHESATYLSDAAHRELGWRLADWKEVIPHNTVFLGDGRAADEDIRRGEELASQHHWN